jgi:hypothetical protein
VHGFSWSASANEEGQTPAGQAGVSSGRRHPLASQVTMTSQFQFGLSPYSHSRPTMGHVSKSWGGFFGQSGPLGDPLELPPLPPPDPLPEPLPPPLPDPPDPLVEPPEPLPPLLDAAPLLDALPSPPPAPSSTVRPPQPHATARTAPATVHPRIAAPAFTSRSRRHGEATAGHATPPSVQIPSWHATAMPP